MLVRVTTGWKAGQIQDIEPTAARLMLADGRATAIDYKSAPDSAKTGAGSPPEAAVDKSEKSAKRKR